MAVKTKVGEFIRAYRIKNGYSQGDLAKILRVSNQQVSNQERGSGGVPWKTCKKLLKLLPSKAHTHLWAAILEDVGRRIK